MPTKKIVFSPFSRIEGDLQIKVDVEGGEVVRSYAVGTLYRGFEAMMRGRDPLDAIVITCRVCGQCGLTHSATSASAIRAVVGARMPPNAHLAINTMLAIEAVLSHLTHFYLSFAPDLAEPPYDAPAAQRFRPRTGGSFARVLREREQLLGVLGIFAGKWPNSLAILPGGTTKPVSASEIGQASGLLGEFIEFIEEQVIGGELDSWLALRSASDMDRWLEDDAHAVGDIGVFIALSARFGLHEIGKWPANFISSGGWPGPTGQPLMRAGFHDGDTTVFDHTRIVEDVKFSWCGGGDTGAHPFHGETEPAPARADAYSWAKAPRYGGKPAEAGPLARMVIDRDPLVTDLLDKEGPSVFVREIARLHETLRLLRQIGLWLNEVDSKEPFYDEAPRAESGEGVGLVEAPRGTLGHWVRVEDGKVRNYQIITPTGWNVSPRDSEGHPGPLEAALVGTPAPDPARPVAVSHVVKSFDPCVFCTVH